jgi:hypothetical protein
MQPVPVSDIVREVKIILNENVKDDGLPIDDTNQLELEELIQSRIVDAVRLIHESATSELLDDGENLASSPTNDTGDGAGWLQLPPDFMRLIIFQMKTWSRPVIEPISDTDPKYFMQHSRFRGIRGGTDKPVCAITTGATQVLGGSDKILEYFSVAAGETTHQILKAKYLPLPKIDGAEEGVALSGSIKVCRKLLIPIHYQCAAMVAVTLKDDIAKNLIDIAKSYL